MNPPPPRLKDYPAKYRYYYYEELDNTKPNGSLVYLMFNPASASPFKDDATIKNCKTLALNNGYSSIEVINLFAERNPVIKNLKCDEIDFNSKFIKQFICKRKDKNIVIACGKTQGKKQENQEKICKLIESCTNKYIIQIKGENELKIDSNNKDLCLINRHPANQPWSKFGGFDKAAELCKCPNSPKKPIVNKC